MLNNIYNSDNTQLAISKHLNTTERLIAKVATKLSGQEKNATIYTMPDLGISSNVTRMCGGFFTGMCATWETDVPFIPVDATVNVCGTAVYKLRNEISSKNLFNNIENVIKNQKQYSFNYNKGNHFVILANSDGNSSLEKGQYLILHASAAEYKKGNMSEGLYPEEGNWFHNDIETLYDDKSDRYLRYIQGNAAEKFYNIAKNLITYNKKRNRFFAEEILGELLEDEVLNVPHYGMPNQNSICIGTQWNNERYTLLTAPGKTIYIIDPVKDMNKNNCFTHCSEDFVLSPHGLGVEFNGKSNLELSSNNMLIGNKLFEKGNSINIGHDAKIRGINETKIQVEDKIQNILKTCKGKMVGELNQVASFTKRGAEIF